MTVAAVGWHVVVRDALEWLHVRSSPYVLRYACPADVTAISVYLGSMAGSRVVAIRPATFRYVQERLQIDIALATETCTTTLFSAALVHWPIAEHAVLNFPTWLGARAELRVSWNQPLDWYAELAPLDVGHFVLPFILELHL